MVQNQKELDALTKRRENLLRKVQAVNQDVWDESGSARVLLDHDPEMNLSRYLDDLDLPNRQAVDSVVLVGKIEELRNIELAIEQVRNGTERRCFDCNLKIPVKRLEARIDAIRCVSCQKKFEESKKLDKSSVFDKNQ